MMRTTVLHRRHQRGFMTAEEIQRLPKPQARRTPKDILERLKYRLDDPRLHEREDYDEDDPSS